MKIKVMLLLTFIFLTCACSKDKKEEVKVKNSDNIGVEEMNNNDNNLGNNVGNTEIVEKNNYVSYNGNLSLKGNNIVNEHGEIFTLQGISSHGLQWFNNLITDENIKTIKSWGANVFRLAMYTKENGYVDNKSIYDDLIKDIDLVIENDMYVIVDWHILSDNNPNNYKAEAIEFFEKISSKYKNTPNIIYEICNEPNGGTSWDDIKSYAVDVIKTIRNNSNNLIIVGTPTWSQDVDSVINNKIDDANTMYALHFYSGTHKEYLREKAKKALDNNIPIFVSEFGVSDASGNGGIYLDEADKWIEFIKNNNLSYINWSLSDKNESSALLKPNSNTINDDTLSDSGKYIKSIFQK